MNPTANSNRLRWQGEWRITLFSAVFVPLFVSLGFWQLQRAEEKVVIGQTWEQRQLEAPLPLSQLASSAAAEVAYRKVLLEGEWLAGSELLLDNRIYGGNYGFEVLTPLRLTDGQLVLVNRGWIAGDRGRRELPQVLTPAGPQRLVGTVYVPPGEAYSLGAETFTAVGPQVLLTVDMAAIGGWLEQPLYPYTVRLEADSAAALTIDWPLLNSSPEKHTGYAVQWFSMAAALLLLFIVRSTNIWQVLRGKENTDSE